MNGSPLVVISNQNGWCTSLAGETEFNNPLQYYYIAYQGNSVSKCTAYNMVDSQWHSIAYEYNGSSISLYIDGSLSGSASTPSVSMINGSNKLVVGSSATPSAFFTGILSLVRRYNVILSASQIKAIYNAKQ